MLQACAKDELSMNSRLLSIVRVLSRFLGASVRACGGGRGRLEGAARRPVVDRRLPLRLAVDRWLPERRGVGSAAIIALAAAGGLSAAGSPARAADAPSTVNWGDYYGFAPLEIFKVENRSHSMIAGDFNSDGRTDLAIVDNSHSRIDLLLQRADPSAARPAAVSDVNHVDNHWRLEHTKIPVDRQIDAMIGGDFNGDGQRDLAYFAQPDRLVVRFQTDGRDWSSKWETRLADVEVETWGIVAGDFNHDGKLDLAVLGKRNTYIVAQGQTPGSFEAPQAIRNTAEELRLGMSGDFDGDGRVDLFYSATSDGERYICVRLQTAKGQLGPEYRLELKNSLGVSVADMLGDGTMEILSISSLTERLGLYRVQRPKPGAEDAESRPIQFGVGVKGTGKRDLDVGDLDGDGLVDVVVSDPDAAQLILYRQHPGSGLDLGTAHASFLGIEQLAVRDLTGDGRAEIVVFSPKEKTLGICGLDADGDRIVFPRTLAIDDDISAFTIVDLNSDSVPEIVYIGKEKGAAKTAKFQLKALTYPPSGETRPYVFGEDKTFVEVDVRDVGRLSVVDANGDNRPDLLVTIDTSRPPTLLVTDARGVPQPATGTGGVQLTEVDAGSVFFGRLDSPALLVAQGAFARRMTLDAQQRWQVVEQYNAGETAAKVKGTATLDLDGKPGAEIVLVDTGAQKLRIFRFEVDTYRPWRTIELGAFPYQSLRVADLNGDRRDDLLLFGGTRFAVLYTGQSDPQIEELATYESERKDAFLVDMVAGDLNGDGRADIAVLDNQSHAIELVAVLPGPKLAAALNFKVFEDKSFHDKKGGGGLEPREMLIADVTGDGRADLVLLAHDRVLVYPQDAGSPPAGAVTDRRP